MRIQGTRNAVIAAMAVVIGGCSNTTFTEVQTSDAATRYVQEDPARFVDANKIYFQGSPEKPELMVASIPGRCVLQGRGWQLAQRDVAQRMTNEYISQGKSVKVFATPGDNVEQAYVFDAADTGYVAHTTISQDECTFELLTPDAIAKLKQRERSGDGGGGGGSGGAGGGY